MSLLQIFNITEVTRLRGFETLCDKHARVIPGSLRRTLQFQ